MSPMNERGSSFVAMTFDLDFVASFEGSGRVLASRHPEVFRYIDRR